MAISKIASAAGWRIVNGSGQSRATKAVAALDQIYAKSPDLLDRVFRFIAGAWADDENAGLSGLFTGIAELFTRIEPSANMIDAWRAKLAKVPIVDIMRRAKAHISIDGFSTTEAYAVAILEAINKGARKKLSLKQR